MPAPPERFVTIMLPGNSTITRTATVLTDNQTHSLLLRGVKTRGDNCDDMPALAGVQLGPIGKSVSRRYAALDKLTISFLVNLESVKCHETLESPARVYVVDIGQQLIAVCLLAHHSNKFAILKDIVISRIMFNAKLPSGNTLHQLPLALVYEMTFDRCQGLTLDVLELASPHQSSRLASFPLCCLAFGIGTQEWYGL
jgi:hypothetical protein